MEISLFVIHHLWLRLKQILSDLPSVCVGHCLALA